MSELTVINVFLGSKMAPYSLKLAPYGNIGVLSTNPSSVSAWRWKIWRGDLFGFLPEGVFTPIYSEIMRVVII